MQKKWVIAITAISLTAVTAIGSTLALLNGTTNNLTNNFTVAEKNGLSAIIREPAWNGYTFDGADATVDQKTLDTTTKPGVDVSTLGKTKAENVYPNAVIDKDPALKNTASNAGTLEFAALKVTLSPVIYNLYLANPSTIDFNTTANGSGYWKQVADWAPDSSTGNYSAVFNYVKDANGTTALVALDHSAPTAKLFSKVSIDKKVDQKTLNGDFNITVNGAVVQANNINTADGMTEATSELNALLK